MPRFGSDFIHEVIASSKRPLSEFMGGEGGAGNMEGFVNLPGQLTAPTGSIGGFTNLPGRLTPSPSMGGFMPMRGSVPDFGGLQSGSIGTFPGSSIAQQGYSAMTKGWVEAQEKKAKAAQDAKTAEQKKKEAEAAKTGQTAGVAPQQPRYPGGYSPSASGQIDQSSREAFLRTAMPYFQQIEAKTGIPAEAMAAIAINEGATTPGTLAYSSGAPFGIKSVGQDPASGTDIHTGYGVNRVSAWEVRNGRDVYEPSSFIQFPDSATAIQGFVDFLQRNPRYAPALQAAQRGTNVQEFIGLLHNAGYATDPAWTTKTTQIANEASRYRVAPPDSADPLGGPVPGGEIRGVRQGDYARAAGLDAATASAICGPAAVHAFVQQNGGRTPSLTEAFDIAKNNNYWDQAVGMHGPEATKAVIERMGVPAAIVRASTPTLAREITQGRLAIVNTRGHYYQATAYDPASDRFRWDDAVGQGRWSTLEGISQWNYGSPDVAIILGGQQ